MPGFVGCVQDDRARAESTVKRMRALMCHAPTYRVGPVTWRDRVALSGVESFPAGWVDAHIHETDALRVWLHGEIFSIDGEDLSQGATAQAIAALYAQQPLAEFAGTLNGIFSAVIHDITRQKVVLLNDRYGFKAPAWTMHRGKLAFASEVKALLALEAFEPTVCEEAVGQFVENGHLLGNTTWFEGVELLGPAGILTYDLSSGQVELERYWRWSDIGERFAGATRRDLEAEMARLLKLAVWRRTRDLERVGCFLSGGLDSRAVFAAIPDDLPDVRAATFGDEDSEEVRIAREVARLRGASHTLYSLTRQNWFRLRTAGVWWTDGHFPILHMHGIGGQPRFRTQFSVNLHGFLGGGIQGRRYGDGEQMFARIESRGRRFINEGVRCAETFVHSRRPFVDYDFVDFAVGLPQAFQGSEQLYQQALLSAFPAYFATIPWEKTGLPVSASRVRVTAKKVADEARWFFDNLKHGFRKSWGPTFADYGRWLVLSPYADQIEAFLLGPERIWPEYLPDEPVEDVWTRLQRGDRTPDWERMCRVLSMEVWLQQAVAGRGRPEDDPEVEVELERLVGMREEKPA